MLSPHRRHGKASPKPHHNDTGASPSDAAMARESSDIRGGLYSYFAQARRRWGKINRDSDTLLPTTYSSPAAPKRSALNPAAKTCNSFLMGGHYYPGKDKKRRHLRRRTLWYKIFCSSNWRKVCSFLLVTYVLLWHILVPFGNWVIHVGSTMTQNRSTATSWLQYDLTLTVPDLQVELKEQIELAAERARMQYGHVEKNSLRLSLLGEIAPAWFHRNDKSEGEKSQKVEAGEAAKAKPIEAGKDMEEPKKDPQKEPKEGDSTSKDKEPKSDTKSTGKQQEAKESAGGESKEGAATPKGGPKSNPERQLQSDPESVKVMGQHLPFRTLQSTARNNSKCNPTSEEATTLVVQTSLNRLWILNETCTRWDDPIVVVVFVPDGTDVTAADLHLNCPNVQVIQYMATEAESAEKNYPVNRLRNIGLDSVTTTHILVVDVDFVPSQGLSKQIRSALQKNQPGDRQALVVPAFDRLPPNPCETQEDCASYLKKNSSFIPTTFEQLKDCVWGKECVVFQSQVNIEGHISTRSDLWLDRKWYEDEAETKLRNVQCFHTARYEPYVVLRWCHGETSQPLAPYYDERFHGYGKNKISLISHLRKSGYQFPVLPEGFIVHNPHPESSIKEIWNEKDSSELHSSMDKLYSEYLKELGTMYNGFNGTTVKLCKRQ